MAEDLCERYEDDEKKVDGCDEVGDGEGERRGWNSMEFKNIR